MWVLFATFIPHVLEKSRTPYEVGKETTMVFLPDEPFNDLPLPSPKAEIETHKILKKAISAGRALAEMLAFRRHYTQFLKPECN